MEHGFLRAVTLAHRRAHDLSIYPFNIPAVKLLGRIPFHPKMTFFVGENGSGKSTLIEALAVSLGYNAEGGTRNFNFATRRSESELHRALRIDRGTRRESTGFFLRAESYFNVATEIEELEKYGGGMIAAYGGISPHEQSHGESFLALVQNRFGPDGLYILDEPEAALSPAKQLTLLARMHQLIEHGRSQFIVATHSPIVLAYPEATIYQLSERGIDAVAYEETEQFTLTRDFLLHRERFFRELFREDQ